MKKIYSLIIELFKQIKDRTRFLSSMHMEVKGLKIVGQGHMISGYSNLDLPEFYNSLKAEVAFVKKCKMRDEITIIDAGANLGFYSMMFSLVENVSILSFEPFPETYQYLEKNILVNKISNVKTIEMGLFSENKNMPIGSPDAFKFYGLLTKLFKFTDKEQAGCNSVFTSDNTAPTAKFVRGDDCSEIRALKHIDLIKIDVEGSELDVLRGLRDTILEHHPVLNVEFSINALAAANLSPSDLWDFLIELGYESYSICSGRSYLETWQSMKRMPEITGSKDYLFTV